MSSFWHLISFIFFPEYLTMSNVVCKELFNKLFSASFPIFISFMFSKNDTMVDIE